MKQKFLGTLSLAAGLTILVAAMKLAIGIGISFWQSIVVLASVVVAVSVLAAAMLLIATGIVKFLE